MMLLSHNEPVTATHRAERPTVDQLIAELRGTAALLEAAVGDALRRSPTRNPDAFDYPPLARSLEARLANVRATIATLEKSARRAAA
jgi:hypothetical protein